MCETKNERKIGNFLRIISLVFARCARTMLSASVGQWLFHSILFPLLQIFFSSFSLFGTSWGCEFWIFAGWWVDTGKFFLSHCFRYFFLFFAVAQLSSAQLDYCCHLYWSLSSKLYDRLTLSHVSMSLRVSIKRMVHVMNCVVFKRKKKPKTGEWKIKNKFDEIVRTSYSVPILFVVYLDRHPRWTHTHTHINLTQCIHWFYVLQNLHDWIAECQMKQTNERTNE